MHFLLIVLTSFAALADPPTEYQEGVKAYQQESYAESSESFRKALESSPNSVSLLFNLGLAEFQQQRSAWAIALWRKALSIDPGYAPAKEALAFASAWNPPRFWQAFDSWEQFRQVFISNRRLVDYLSLLAIFMAFGGWLSIAYLGRRRLALDNDMPLPPFPSVALIFVAAFTVICILTSLKAFDLTRPRATVVEAKVSVLTLPDNESNNLFELQGGQEVIVLQKKKDWTQVAYPGGMSGWVPEKYLFKTYGRGE